MMAARKDVMMAGRLVQWMAFHLDMLMEQKRADYLAWLRGLH